MKVFRKLPLSAALALALGGPAHAQSLVELFESARAYDATYQAAKAQYEANKSKADQALALLLPTSNLVLSANRAGMTTLPVLRVYQATPDGLRLNLLL